MKNELKTFTDLVFTEHPNPACFSTHAKMHFDNGYGISVITGECAYTHSSSPYEVAVLKDHRLCYDTHITDDVIGYCTAEKVTEIMKQIQEL